MKGNKGAHLRELGVRSVYDCRNVANYAVLANLPRLRLTPKNYLYFQFRAVTKHGPLVRALRQPSCKKNLGVCRHLRGSSVSREWSEHRVATTRT